jgi:hypothetical protein
VYDVHEYHSIFTILLYNGPSLDFNIVTFSITIPTHHL